MSGFSVVNTSTLTSVSALYQVTTAFGGNNVGDILQSVEIYNQQVNPAVVIDTVWNNLTQQTALGAITPSSANILPIDSVTNLKVDTSALFFAVVGRAGQYAINDVLQQVVVLDPYTTPPTAISTTYNNLTTGAQDVTLTLASDIVPVGTPGTGVSSYDNVVTVYTATAASAGQFAIGDKIQNVQTFNPATVPPTLLDSTWNNLTQQTVLTVVPTSGEISPGTSTAVTADVVTTALYTAAVAQTDYAIGDVIQQVVVLDPSTVPPTVVSTEYNNLTQDTRNITIVAPTDISPGSSSASSDVANTEIYTVQTAFGISNANDVLQNLRIYDPATVPPTLVSSSWYNQTQQVAEPTAPAATDIIPGNQTAGVAAYSTVPSLFVAVANNVGQYVVGDVIQKVEVLYTTAIPPTVISTTYDNLTTGVNNITLAAIADLEPVSTTAQDYYTSTSVLWKAITAGTGYSVNDIIEEVVIYDPSVIPPTVISNTFNNVNTGGFNIAPLYADIVPLGTPSAQDVPLSATALYTVTTAGTGTSVGDVLLLTTVYDPSTVPPTVTSSAWANLTAGTDLSATPPSYVDIVPANPESFVSASNLYTVTTAFAGGAVGDVLENIISYDPAVSPIVAKGSVWNNLTQGTAGITAPLATDVIPGTSQATTSNFAITTLYTATATVGGSYNIGDVLQSVATYNPATIPATLVDTIWNDLTLGTILAAAPVIGNITPGQSQSSVTDTVYTAEYQVITAGTGTTVGDILQRVVTINPVTSAIVATVWDNLTAGSTLGTAPSYTDITPVTPAITPTYSTVTSLYYVVTSGTGYAVNDVVQKVETFSTDAGLPVLITTDWYNLTQDALIPAGVTIADVLPVGTPTAAANNYTTVAELYYAGVSIAPYNINDQLVRVIVFDTKATAPAAPVSETWYNLTQQTTLAAIPPTTDVLPGTSPGAAQTVSVDTTALYYAVSSNTDYAVNDVIQQVVALNPATVPPTVLSTTYNNLTADTQDITVVISELLPIGTPANYSSVSNYFVANTTNGPAGYTAGDSISQVMVLDQTVSPPAFLSQLWTNTTTGNIIATPGTLSQLTGAQSQLPPAIGPQTNANSLSVYVANQSALSYFPVVTQYAVSTAFVSPAPGAALGDVVQDIQIYDATVNPALLVSSSWSNLTTGASYATAPSITDLTPTFGNALTNAELRAAPVVVEFTPVSRVSAMISVGASTTAATTAGIVSASFYNNSTTVAATVAGGTLPPSTAISFQANDSDTLAAISYTTGVGGSLLIATLT